MSYTPTTWATGDTITASAMNKIENGIANAGGGGGPVACVIWFPNSVAGWQVNGDFNSALALVQQGVPVACLFVDVYETTSISFSSGGIQFLGASYTEDYPNQIDFIITAGRYFSWTANGVTYND